MIRRRKNLVEWLKSRLVVQVFSACVALAAWMFVNSGQMAQQRRNIRILYVQTPSNLVFEKNPLKEVKVDLSGSLYRLRSIRDEDLTYPVDLSSAKPGVTHIEMDLENLRLPLDVEAAHFSPRSFNLYLEEIFARSLPVKVVFVGKPREGYQIGAVKTRPEAIQVTGPKSIVSKLSEVEIEVSLASRELSFSERIQPKLSFPGADALESVAVEVEISTQKLRREFPLVPVSAGQIGRKVKITPPTGKVILEGPDAEIRGIESKLEILIPSEGLRRGRFRMRGSVNLPDKVKLISIEPESYLVEVLQDGSRK